MSECPVCRFENSPSRRFCQNCGSALAPAPNGPAQAPPKTDELATLTAELQLARQQLEQARQEEDRLAKHKDASEEEGKSLRQQRERMAN